MSYESFLSRIDELVDQERQEKDIQFQKRNYKKKVIQKHSQNNGIVSNYQTKKKREREKLFRTAKNDITLNRNTFFEKCNLLKSLEQEVWFFLTSKQLKIEILNQQIHEASLAHDISKQRYEKSVNSTDLYSFEIKQIEDSFQNDAEKLLGLEEKKKNLLNRINEVQYERDIAKVNSEGAVSNNGIDYQEKKNKKKNSILSKVHEERQLKIMKKKKLLLEKKIQNIEKLRNEKEKQFKELQKRTIDIRAKTIARTKAIEKEFRKKKREEKKMKLEKQRKKDEQMRILNERVLEEQNRIKGINERIKKRKKAILEAEKHEMRRIKSEGRNPYAVLKRRKEIEAIVRNNVKFLKRKKENEAKINKTLEEEFNRYKKEKRKEEKKKKVLDRWRKELSNAKSNKTSKYIKSKTLNNLEIIDPLNKQHVLLPSEFMVVKDWKFGLGMSSNSLKSKAFLKTMKKKYKTVGVYKSFIPKTPKLKKKKEKVEMDDDGASSDEEMLVNEFPGYW